MIQSHCKVGEVLEDKQARERKLILKPVIVEHGWTLLWKCPTCGKYWESRWEGRYDECEYLTCLEDEEVSLRYADKISGKQK